jgi:co-chaperonin GroES (HSP10)
MINITSNRVMLQPIVEERRSPGGLLVLVPEKTTFTHGKWKEELSQTKGEVIAIGPKVTDVKVGDIVRHSDSCGHLLMVDGVERRFIRDDDVAAIL